MRMFFKLHSKKIKLFFCSVFLILFSRTSFAFSEDTQFWSQYIFMVPVAKKTSYGIYLEYQTRHSFDQQRNYATLLRPALFYNLNSDVSFFLGYMSLRQSNFREIEERIWQQVTSVHKFELGNVSLRFRQEQRWRKNPINQLKGRDEIAHRSRLLVRLTFLNIFKNVLDLKPLMMNELLWNLNRVDEPNFQTIDAGYDQNRFFLGFTKKLNETWMADFGYLNMNVNRQRSADLVVHGMFFTLWHKL